MAVADGRIEAGALFLGDPPTRKDFRRAAGDELDRVMVRGTATPACGSGARSATRDRRMAPLAGARHQDPISPRSLTGVGRQWHALPGN